MDKETHCQALEKRKKDLLEEIAALRQELKTRQYSENKYRAFFESSLDALLITSPDGRVMEANAEACRMLGFTQKELIRAGRDGVVDHGDTRLIPALEERARTGRYRGELTFRRKDGTRFPVDITSVLFNAEEDSVRSSIIVRDLSQSKHMETELKRVNSLLESVYMSLDEAVFVVDPATRIIISCNRAAEVIFGYSRDEMTGRNTEFIHENRNSYRRFGKKLTQTLDADGIARTQYRLKKKDGTIFPSEHTVKTVVDDLGRPILHVSVVRDITREKHTAGILEKKQAELAEKARRLEELNTALRVLLEQRDLEKKDLELKFMENLSSLVLPYLDRIRRTGLTDLQEEYVAILELNLRELLKPFQQQSYRKLMGLTPMETKIANQVKQGHRIKEIASRLKISPRTVEFHRDNIRKKLDIKGLKINLQTFLTSPWEYGD
ncbi:MAG: PAS domain S-box protein [Pseudomonadota bacterium]